MDGRVFDFSAANVLKYGHYEWQTPNLFWAVGDSIALKLSVPGSQATETDVLLEATMTVGNYSSEEFGWYDGDYGSMSFEGNGSFTYEGTTHELIGLSYRTWSTPWQLVVLFDNGGEDLDGSNVRLKLGDDEFTFAEGTFDEEEAEFVWDDPGLSWSDDDEVAVQFLPPASSGQVAAAEPPAVTGAPDVSGAGGDGSWSAGETVEVTLTFTEAVDVDIEGGTPSLDVALGGTAKRTADYASGSGTTELVFRHRLAKGESDYSTVSVTPNSLALNSGTIRGAASGVDALLAHQGAFVQGSGSRSETPASSTAPRAAFSNPPERHDGSSTFVVDLTFSREPAGLSYRTVGGSLLEVTGGSVVGARRLTPGSNIGWRVMVEPSVRGDVTITLPVRACTETNAICVGGEALAAGASITVPGPDTYTAEPVPQTLGPITASWVRKPDGHDGSTAFDLHLDFSHEPAAGFSYRSIAGGVVSVRGGGITRVWRRVHGRSRNWGVQVTPSGNDAVTASVNGTGQCGAAHAVCDAAGRKLEAGAEIRVEGPAVLSVADAAVRESQGATLDFVVSLSRARSESTTVDYATSDGTARAGDDYTAASGTLTFLADETSKTLAVTVRSDAHDEGDETMTLALSDPSGARIGDGTATGTIENSGAMPKAWMVRFGRTVGTHVVDALGARLEGGGGSHVTVAGVRLGGEGREPEAGTDDDPFGLPAWTQSRREAPARTLSTRDILLGSAFHLSSREAGAGAGPAFTAWGRVTTGGFETEEDGVRMDADVTTGLVGVDAEWDRVLAGVMLSRSEGEGAYRLDPEHGDDRGTVDGSMTGVYPYARVGLGARVSAWALAGAGTGELTLRQHEGAAMPAELSMRMGAVGVKGRVLDGTGASGIGLNLESDALWVSTESEDTAELAATEGDVTRLRLTLRGERVFATTGGATFTPSAEVGLRHDGGDAETGTGIELGAGVRYTAGSLGIEGRVRTLVAHEASGYEEWGASGAIRVTPSASGRGLALTIAPQWGRTGSATERLWSARDASALGARSEFKPSARLAIDASYGFGLGAERGVLTPYAGLTLGEASSRAMRTGARWDLGPDLAVGLEGARSETAGGGDAGVRVRTVVRF